MSEQEYSAGYKAGKDGWNRVGDPDLAESLANETRDRSASAFLSAMRDNLEGSFEVDDLTADFVLGFAECQVSMAQTELERALREHERDPDEYREMIRSEKRDVAALERMSGLLRERVAKVYSR